MKSIFALNKYKTLFYLVSFSAAGSSPKNFVIHCRKNCFAWIRGGCNFNRFLLYFIPTAPGSYAYVFCWL